MPKISDSDLKLIERLHSLVFNDTKVREVIHSGFKIALAAFKEPEYSLPYSSHNLSMHPFINKLSDEDKERIGLCRLFILRAGCKMPQPEIHRNSIQRLVSYKGSGVILSATPGGIDMTFTEYPIVSPNKKPQTSFDKSWDIVPKNTWHFPVAERDEDWYSVTFHSATEKEIIDEYWKPNMK